jgi:hypothetical protein
LHSSAVLVVAGNDNDGPTASAREWLARGVGQPGGKLPLFDDEGQTVSATLVHDCIAKGWVEPWFTNPLKPDWIVCKLTPAGRNVAAAL